LARAGRIAVAATTRTLLVHSGAGVAALIVGLRCLGDEASVFTHLPRLWPAVSRPGHFICLSQAGNRVICLNSGRSGDIAQRLMEDAGALWDTTHLRSLYVKEGLFSALRFRLFLRFPAQKWLLRFELAQRYEV
jgi:hypothetical protein